MCSKISFVLYGFIQLYPFKLPPQMDIYIKSISNKDGVCS